jgi:hypothetical protein
VSPAHSLNPSDRREISPRRRPSATPICVSVAERIEPIVDVLLGLILGQAVALLQLAFELLALAVDDSEVVIGELAPLLLDLARHLFLVPFDLIPIHDGLPIAVTSFQSPTSFCQFVEALKNPHGAIVGRSRAAFRRPTLKAPPFMGRAVATRCP